MTPEQQVQWEELYQLLELAQQHSIKLCIDPLEKVSITIHTLGRSESGCGQCRVRYDSFDLTGCLWDLTENPKLKSVPYTGDVSQYHMHSCPDDEGSKDFAALYKLHLDNSMTGMYWHRFVDLQGTIRQVGSRMDRL